MKALKSEPLEGILTKSSHNSCLIFSAPSPHPSEFHRPHKPSMSGVGHPMWAGLRVCEQREARRSLTLSEPGGAGDGGALG